MSLISATNSPNLPWETLQDTTTELRTGCLALEQSLQQIFQEIEQMRLELVDRLQEVEQERQRLDSCQEQFGQRSDEAAELASALAERDAELAETRAELHRVREEAEQQRQRAAKSADEDESGLRAELNSSRDLLQSLRAEFEAMRNQRDAFQQRAELGEADRTRLAEVEAELLETRRQLSADRRATVTLQAMPSADNSLTVSVEQFSAMEEERAALEAELELVRNRAAELNETVTLQQLQIAEQKTELSGELQQLRRLMEKQTDLIADRTAEVDRVSRAAEEPPAERTQPCDPVVNSVMAQFAKLQKDVAQRRRRK